MKSSTQVAYRDAPFQLRGSSFTMMVLKVGDPRNPNFFPVLAGKLAQAPNFFRNAPVVLDLDDLPVEALFDFDGFTRLLRNLGLIAVGLQGGTPEQQRGAIAAGLAVLPASKEARTFDPLAGTGRAPAQGAADLPPLHQMGQQQTAPPPPPPPAPVEPPPPVVITRSTLVVNEAVRSGRQIYAEGGDLVVIGPVSAGAELAADGSIHVYGALRGRALAGVSGDREARIFCQSLEADLVSIAGLYRVADDMDSAIRRRPVQIHLSGDGFLHIDPIGS